jgi:hypothetical protein
LVEAMKNSDAKVPSPWMRAIDATRDFEPGIWPQTLKVSSVGSTTYTRGTQRFFQAANNLTSMGALVFLLVLFLTERSNATTKGLSQIVTPDLQKPGDFSLSFQAQAEQIANPYEIQAEFGLTKWAEIAVFKGFKPNELIFATELGLIQKEPYLLSIGFVNWSPHSHVDPQPFIEAGYCTEHHKFFGGAIHAGYRNEAIVGYAYDFNKTWRAQVDFQSGSGNSSTIGVTCNVTRDFQFNPAIYVTNDRPHDVLGYIVFTYTFHLWGEKKTADAASVK